MNHNSRVLVTGANGFLGTYVTQALVLAGIQDIKGICRTKTPRNQTPQYSFGDLADSHFVKGWMDAYEPDVVMHLAANPIVKVDEESQASQIINDNVTATQNLLAYAPRGCVFINASSVTVYGTQSSQDRNLPFDDFDTLLPESVYAATKAASEHLVQAYTALGRVRGVNLRLVANVGAHSTHGVLKDIIRKLRSDNPQLELLGAQPGSSKPYIYAGDTAQAFVLAATSKGWCGDTFNISVDGGINILSIANLVMDELGIHKPIAWLGEEANWRGDTRLLRVNNWRAVVRGWTPRFKSSKSAILAAIVDILTQEAFECQKVS